MRTEALFESAGISDETETWPCLTRLKNERNAAQKACLDAQGIAIDANHKVFELTAENARLRAALETAAEELRYRAYEIGELANNWSATTVTPEARKIKAKATVASDAARAAARLQSETTGEHDAS